MPRPASQTLAAATPRPLLGGARALRLALLLAAALAAGCGPVPAGDFELTDDDTGGTYNCTVGETFNVVLTQCGGAPDQCVWGLSTYDDDILRFVDEATQAGPVPLAGAESTRHFHFECINPGQSPLTFGKDSGEAWEGTIDVRS